MKISSEIKAKLFAQYLGQEVCVRKKNDRNRFLYGRSCEVTLKSNHGDWVKVWFDEVETVTNTNWELNASNAHTFFFNEDETLLMLRPLSEITDDEKIKLFDTDDIGNECTTAFKIGRVCDWIRDGNIYPHLKHTSIEFLRSIGVDVPHYLLEGKTLTEAGLAAYVPSQKNEA